MVAPDGGGSRIDDFRAESRRGPVKVIEAIKGGAAQCWTLM